MPEPKDASNQGVASIVSDARLLFLILGVSVGGGGTSIANRAFDDGLSQSDLTAIGAVIDDKMKEAMSNEDLRRQLYVNARVDNALEEHVRRYHSKDSGKEE